MAILRKSEVVFLSGRQYAVTLKALPLIKAIAGPGLHW
jgi:hypothetical protein